MNERGPKGPEMSDEEVRKMVNNILYYTLQLLLKLIPDEEKSTFGNQFAAMKLRTAAEKIAEGWRARKLPPIATLHDINDDGTEGESRQIVIGSVMGFLRTHFQRNPNITVADVLRDINPPRKLFPFEIRDTIH